MDHGVDFKALFSQFESLGDNCEFGVVQRQAGIEPLGFFRFSFTPWQSLLRALDVQFADVGKLESIDLYQEPSREFMIKIKGYEFTYHSGRMEGEIEPDELRGKEVPRIAFLTRKLIDELQTGEKIFVRTGRDGQTLDDAFELHDLMLKYGPCTLLWVTVGDDAAPPGSVRVARPGVLHGRIDRFASYIDAHSSSFTAWVNLCSNALHLRRGNAPAGAALAAPNRTEQLNLLSANAPIPWQGNFETKTWGNVSVGSKNLPSYLHVTGDEMSPHLFFSEFAGCFADDETYTFSGWVNIPKGSPITTVEVTFEGLPRQRVRRANIDLLDHWQRIEASAYIPPGRSPFMLRLYVHSSKPAVFRSALWRLEPGLLVTADAGPTDILPTWLKHGAWRSPGAATSLNTEVSSIAPHSSALKHTLLTQTDHSNGAVFMIETEDVGACRSFSAGASVYIPNDFRGTEVSVILLGCTSHKIVRADLSKREHWQTVGVTTFVENTVSKFLCALYVIGDAGTTVYSANWVFSPDVELEDLVQL